MPATRDVAVPASSQEALGAFPVSAFTGPILVVAGVVVASVMQFLTPQQSISAVYETYDRFQALSHEADAVPADTAALGDPVVERRAAIVAQGRERMRQSLDAVSQAYASAVACKAAVNSYWRLAGFSAACRGASAPADVNNDLQVWDTLHGFDHLAASITADARHAQPFLRTDRKRDVFLQAYHAAVTDLVLNATSSDGSIDQLHAAAEALRVEATPLPVSGP